MIASPAGISVGVLNGVTVGGTAVGGTGVRVGGGGTGVSVGGAGVGVGLQAPARKGTSKAIRITIVRRFFITCGPPGRFTCSERYLQDYTVRTSSASIYLHRSETCPAGNKWAVLNHAIAYRPAGLYAAW
ncbi:MAG: hypothetical protein D9V45_04795 [Chloroflexi bacterium]|nr:MAG: hypothetical protein D9V45_04795 [Chloroflexota bacterium]